MNYSVIQLALDDFKILLDTYKATNFQMLERITNRLISLYDGPFKDQLLISQSIILENLKYKKCIKFN